MIFLLKPLRYSLPHTSTHLWVKNGDNFFFPTTASIQTVIMVHATVPKYWELKQHNNGKKPVFYIIFVKTTKV